MVLDRLFSLQINLFEVYCILIHIFCCLKNYNKHFIMNSALFWECSQQDRLFVVIRTCIFINVNHGVVVFTLCSLTDNVLVAALYSHRFFMFILNFRDYFFDLSLFLDVCSLINYTFYTLHCAWTKFPTSMSRILFWRRIGRQKWCVCRWIFVGAVVECRGI